MARVKSKPERIEVGKDGEDGHIVLDYDLCVECGAKTLLVPTTTWPITAGRRAPLCVDCQVPQEKSLCFYCGEEQRLRMDGKIGKHLRPNARRPGFGEPWPKDSYCPGGGRNPRANKGEPR